MRRVSLLVILALVTGAPAYAQPADDLVLPRPANCCLLNSAKSLAEQLQDWNQLGRYHAANEKLKKQPAIAGRVVFISPGFRAVADRPSCSTRTEGPQR